MKKDINKIKSVIIFLIICVLAIISLSIFEEIKRAKLLYPVSYKESIADDSICNNCEMKIPKIIHRIWTVWDPHKREMSDTYKKFDKILKDLHPDWQIMEWDDEKIEKFIKLNYPDFIEVYLSYDTPTKKHDASRFLILNHYGGVFIQHSIKLSKNIEPLLRGYDAVFTEQSVSDNTIPNGFFAIIPNHKIFAGITWKLKERSKLYVTQATGPLFISALVRDYISKNGKNGLKILPPKYILPFDWIQKNSEPTYSDCIINHDKCFIHYPEAYGFCLWTGAWIGKYY